MRLIENLRDAEKKGMSSVRKTVERAREEWVDVERRIRQRMRIYPQKLRNKMNARSGDQPETANIGAAAAAGRNLTGNTTSQKPIISVHGHDVSDEEIDNSAA